MSLITYRYDPSLTYGRAPRYASRQFVPRYALFAQKCLRFKAFFRQGVFDSPDEHYRVRHVDIVYYLEDDTLCVIEPVVDNAGFQQGKLVRRDRIPKNAKGDPFIWKDFNVGINVCTLSVIEYDILRLVFSFRLYHFEQTGRSISSSIYKDPPQSLENLNKKKK